MSTDFGLSQIGQIAITVTDVPRAIAFYRDVLGLKFLFEAAKPDLFPEALPPLDLHRRLGHTAADQVHGVQRSFQDKERLLDHRQSRPVDPGRRGAFPAATGNPDRPPADLIAGPDVHLCKGPGLPAIGPQDDLRFVLARRDLHRVG